MYGICSRPVPAPCRLTIDRDGTRLVLEVCPVCCDRLLDAATVGKPQKDNAA